MSYDLQVFAQRSLTGAALRGLLASASLATEESSETSDVLMVVRGARRRYSFTVELPATVEAEDVPEEITAVLLGAKYRYDVLVEGSDSTEVRHAVRFARAIAGAASGAVLDQQTGRTWARGRLRAAPAVQRGVIDVVELQWYVRPPDADGDDAARLWLELARRHLPEALPRRFGPFEPPTLRLDRDGPEAFIAAVAAEDLSSLGFLASAPCIEGSLAAGQRMTLGAHQLLVHREPLNDARWRGALRRLFIEFAAGTKAIFGSAEVLRGLEWSGRGVWYTATTENTIYLAPRGVWKGLSPDPAWWTWFGPEYRQLVADHLPKGKTQVVGSGLFHWRSEQPSDHDELIVALRAGQASGFLGHSNDSDSELAESTTAVTWLPADLLARVGKKKLRRARNMPSGLRPKEQPGKAEIR